MLIVVKMGRWSELSACSVLQVVLLYSEVEMVVMSGDEFCWNVEFGTLVGLSVFSDMCSELLMISEIRFPL